MKLEITGLTKCFGTHAALDGLDLHVEEGRVIVLVGPSGGGKSTLLRVLGGLETPDEGRVSLRGEDLPVSESGLLAYRRKNGFLFQQFNLFPHLTALRNLTLPLEEVHGMPAPQAKQTAEAALDRFGLLAHAHKRPAELSGGQQQRVGIARAVASKPEILFLDEPTSALDPEMTAEVLELIQELAEGGQRIILSTHEMGFARAVGDLVAFLAAGKVVEAAHPTKWFEQPQSEQAKRFLSRVLRYV
ncbi:amino acid ABC transporter ATP-binding protein [Luteolibacter sp. GHJ8]|uniref:Amino acid ABC transporter ATP-binding protein n=1 Tax=Luteolibacter rhizosphaerae TaxID=2989719 RepID=A0ABT3G4Y9_9BACT|nr:amino acid ABC transporter ATP-binding protein [Luteolibacter rhizosphaerae]MCW1914300.1 amino acid ABC transporter ATP-binding protein [Luteolibacter rhizosphaerae]